MALLLAPSGVTGAFKVPVSANTYTPDGNGIVTVVNNNDIAFLTSQGFFQLPLGRFNLNASADPGAGNDNTQDYLPGSIWINTTASPNRAWLCSANATGAATWIQLGSGSTAGGSASFAALSLTGLLSLGFTGAITAFSGGGQASAVALTAGINVISVVAAQNDSVKLPSAASVSTVNGAPLVVVVNSATNGAAVYGNGADTIDGLAGSSGYVYLPGRSLQVFLATGANSWQTLFSSFGMPNHLTTTNSATTATTLTAANVTGAREVFLHMTGTLASGQALTLPTMASVIALLPSLQIGSTYKLRILNESSGAFSWTITNNSWTTFTVPNPAIVQKTWQDLIITVLSTTTLKIEAVGNTAASTAQP